MTIEQLYISSLNIPAIEIKITDQQPSVKFKKGKILTQSYIEMFKRVPKHDGFLVLCHTQTLFTFCFIKDKTAYLIGPEIVNYNDSGKHYNLNSKIIYLSKQLNTTILDKEQCYQQILFFSQLIKHPLRYEDVDKAFENAISANQLDDTIASVTFNDGGVHISYMYERTLKSAVVSGDLSAVHSAFLSLVSSGRIGILSDEGKLRSIKNWGIIVVSVTLRSVINAGIDYEQAYSLNDQYVRTIELLTAFDDVMQKIEEILKDMARRVQSLRNVHLSKSIRHIYQLIIDSPEIKLTLPQLANQLNLSPHYISTLFKKEVGVSISRFRILVKINRAIQLILTTNLSLSEIAAQLNFADQAHLCRDFKSLVGVCPNVARKNPHYTENWNMYDFMNINIG